ncbi:hypothetical protein RTCIAT899_CH02795 [Rhizobium tropici CIAT 899]|nr:hypothetical protein RTCIAT899_CH02795 [Rhizobium tropici CIAT 899]
MKMAPSGAVFLAAGQLRPPPYVLAIPVEARRRMSLRS